MTNRLVKTAYVTYTPAVPEVVGRPAYCITIDTPKVGASNPFGQNSKPAFKNGYWLGGVGEAVRYTAGDGTTHVYWWVSYNI